MLSSFPHCRPLPPSMLQLTYTLSTSTSRKRRSRCRIGAGTSWGITAGASCGTVPVVSCGITAWVFCWRAEYLDWCLPWDPLIAGYLTRLRHIGFWPSQKSSSPQHV
jgi:hypothetical protein